MSKHKIIYPPLPAERDYLKPHPLLAGMFYYPSSEYSIPADNLCWHVPPSPDADYRCIRDNGHRGKHKYAWSPILKDHSHKSNSNQEGGPSGR